MGYLACPAGVIQPDATEVVPCTQSTLALSSLMAAGISGASVRAFVVCQRWKP